MSESALDQFDMTIKRDYLKYNLVESEDNEENNNRQNNEINYKYNGEFKNPELYDIEAEFHKLNFDLKSIVLSRTILQELMYEIIRKKINNFQ